MKTLRMVVLIALFSPVSAFAGRISGTIKGGLTSQTSGACNVGYSTYCPSGNCYCDEFTGTISGNPIGKGTVILDATVDQGAALSNSPTCYPVFLILQVNARDTEIINGVGSACNTNGQIDALSGGFGIIQSAVGAAGWGTVKGTFNLSTGAAVVKYSGTSF